LDSVIVRVNQFKETEWHTRGISIEQCSAQFELAAHNKLLTDRSVKTLKSAWTVFVEQKLTVTAIWQSF